MKLSSFSVAYLAGGLCSAVSLGVLLLRVLHVYRFSVNDVTLGAIIVLLAIAGVAVVGFAAILELQKRISLLEKRIEKQPR